MKRENLFRSSILVMMLALWACVFNSCEDSSVYGYGLPDDISNPVTDIELAGEWSLTNIAVDSVASPRTY